MDTLLKADIFFVITSIAVVLLTIGGVVALVYVIKILREVKSITELLRREGEHLSEDVEELRTQVRNKGVTLAVLGTLARKFWKRRTAKRARKKEETEGE